MSGSPRRLVASLGLACVAVPAAVATHCAGYELAAAGERVLGPLAGGDPHALHGGTGHGAHLADVHAGHLPLIPLTSGALLVGALLVLAALLGGRRAAGVRAPHLGSLLIAQFAVLVAIEAAGAVGGMTPNPAFVLVAVALQVPVAVAVVLLARSTQRLVARLLHSSPRLARRQPLAWVPRSADVSTAVAAWSVRPPGRAPPRLGGVPIAAALLPAV